MWDHVHVNVGGHLAMTRLVLPTMQAMRRGLILNVGSQTAVRPSPLLSVYSATKVRHGILSLVIR